MPPPSRAPSTVGREAARRTGLSFRLAETLFGDSTLPVRKQVGSALEPGSSRNRSRYLGDRFGILGHWNERLVPQIMAVRSRSIGTVGKLKPNTRAKSQPVNGLTFFPGGCQSPFAMGPEPIAVVKAVMQSRPVGHPPQAATAATRAAWIRSPTFWPVMPIAMACSAMADVTTDCAAANAPACRACCG